MAKRLIPVETACPLVKSMGAIGDWLSFLIVLDACKGPQRFDEFQTNLGLTRMTCRSASEVWWHAASSRPIRLSVMPIGNTS
jgi:hypothetical protein